MQINSDEAAILDSILELTLKLNVGRNLTITTIHKHLPSITQSQAEHYFKMLANYRPKIVEAMAMSQLHSNKAEVINKTDFTSQFLNDGGFKKVYTDQIAADGQIQIDRDLQRANWIASTRSAKWSLRLSIVAILISIVALILPYIVSYLSRPISKPIGIDAKTILKQEKKK